ncbi:MAG: hypothetical protein LBG50_03825, partial [Clostridiales Family XIII bacterium]|nr:hypothetical protein [Clostridiales Family XIII bacterium]
MKTNPKASDRDSVTAAVRHPFAAPAAECRGRTAFGGLGNTGKKRRGSALVWSMAVIIVLLVMVMIVAQVITASFRGTVESEVNTQAYYTARTVNERLVNWLSGAKWSPSYAVNLPSNPAPTDAQKFIKNLINGNGWAGGVATDDDGHTVVSEYGEADLGGSMGTADAKISVNYDDPDPDRQNRIITVETAGHFGDETKSVKTQLFLHTDSTYSYSFTSFLASGSAFSPAAAREKADELNAFTPDPDPVILGRYLYYNSGRKVINDDSMDIDTLAAANMTDEREAKWEHYYT